MLTPQELGVCGESSEINGEKIVLCPTAEKKFLLLKRSKMTCMIKLAVEKSLISKKNHTPPHVSNGLPLS